MYLSVISFIYLVKCFKQCTDCEIAECALNLKTFRGAPFNNKVLTQNLSFYFYIWYENANLINAEGKGRIDIILSQATLKSLKIGTKIKNCCSGTLILPLNFNGALSQIKSIETKKLQINTPNIRSIGCRIANEPYFFTLTLSAVLSIFIRNTMTFSDKDHLLRCIAKSFKRSVQFYTHVYNGAIYLPADKIRTELRIKECGPNDLIVFRSGISTIHWNYSIPSEYASSFLFYGTTLQLIGTNYSMNAFVNGLEYDRLITEHHLTGNYYAYTIRGYNSSFNGIPSFSFKVIKPFDFCLFFSVLENYLI